MRVSMSWLRDLVQLPSDVTTQQVADALTRVGLQVERIEATGGDVTGPVVIGRVEKFVDEPQKNGKVIRWCQVNVGDHNPEGEAARGIVCGAHNFTQGDYVVVALPGAVLPGDFAIASRKTYGHVSDGMMCAADELGLGGDHSGIIVLPATVDARPLVLGEDALDVLQARDEVLDIDVTPDMGYCLSMRGIAREVAQAFGVAFEDPYRLGVPADRTTGFPVRIETDRCDLFVALTLTGVDVAALTPTWMRHRLEAAGMRSISIAVDVTNYVMLESGQPLHAYDAESLRTEIVVRNAWPNEKLVTLDGVERALDVDDVIITDQSGPIGIAGVMGGETTEVTEATSCVVLEAAHFDPVSVGRSFRRHKLPSEASKRFERGVDRGLAFAAAMRAAELLVRFAGAQLVEADQTVVGNVAPMPMCRIDAGLPSRILGADISRETVIDLLAGAGVDVTAMGDSLTLTPPTWRTDLVEPYDYVEEVARKFGFDNVPATLPLAPPGRGMGRRRSLRRLVGQRAAASGFVEVITLPFVGVDELDRMGLPADDARRNTVRLANPLADTQPFLRPTLLPGLFAAAGKNTSRSQTDIALFEIGSVFWQGGHAAPMPSVATRPSDDEISALYQSLPSQPTMIAAILTGSWREAGWRGAAEPADWTHAVALADTIAATLGLDLARRNSEKAPWHPGRCAELLVGDEIVGHAGELHPTVCAKFGLPERACAIELNLDRLIEAAPTSGEILPLSPFPLTKQDVALVVDADVPAEMVRQALAEGGGELLESVTLFDVYTGAQVGEGKKSLAFALAFRGADRTLTEEDASAAKDRAVQLAAERCGAAQRA